TAPLFQCSYQIKSALPSPLASASAAQSGAPHPVTSLPLTAKPPPVERNSETPWLFHCSYQARSALPSPSTSPTTALSGVPMPSAQRCTSKPLPVESATVIAPLFQCSYQARSALPSPLKSPLADQSGAPKPVSHCPSGSKCVAALLPRANASRSA